MERLLLKKVDLAKGNPNYNAYDYFNDLAEVYRLQNKYSGGPSGLSEINELQRLSRPHSSLKDIEKARDKFTAEFRPESRPEPAITMPEILHWLAGAYLYLLPWAALIFLVWIFESEKKNFLKNPLSLLLCLTAYPVVLSWILIKWSKDSGQQILTEAEIRRTKEKFFTLLSEDELHSFRLFAANRIKLRSVRRQLQQRAVRLKHSLVSIAKTSKGFLKNIDHIPLCGLTENSSVNQPNLKNQLTNHETDYNLFVNCFSY
jgi:hypothetical protein